MHWRPVRSQSVGMRIGGQSTAHPTDSRARAARRLSVIFLVLLFTFIVLGILAAFFHLANMKND